jgi:hypothetical protein
MFDALRILRSDQAHATARSGASGVQEVNNEKTSSSLESSDADDSSVLGIQRDAISNSFRGSLPFSPFGWCQVRTRTRHAATVVPVPA